MSFALSDQQINYFNVFGYLKLPGLFADEIANIQERFTSIFENHDKEIVNWNHPTHENRDRRFIPRFLEKDKELGELLGGQRVKAIMNSVIGEAYKYRASDGSIFDCGTLFHQDSFGADPKSLNIKCGLYLDKVDESSGALRVIPGSHHAGDKYRRLLNKNVIETSTAFGRPIDEIPVAVLDSNPGDLLLWDYRILHAACYRGNERRMIAMEFSGPNDK